MMDLRARVNVRTLSPGEIQLQCRERLRRNEDANVGWFWRADGISAGTPSGGRRDFQGAAADSLSFRIRSLANR
jgi:hypothetical protein